MNPTTGKTSGDWRGISGFYDESERLDANGNLVPIPRDISRHCPHADKLRLRRLPKWITFATFIRPQNLKAFRRALGRHDRYAREGELSAMFGL